MSQEATAYVRNQWKTGKWTVTANEALVAHAVGFLMHSGKDYVVALIDDIMGEAAYMEPGAIRRALDKLEAKGYLRRVRRVGIGNGYVGTGFQLVGFDPANPRIRSMRGTPSASSTGTTTTTPSDLTAENGAETSHSSAADGSQAEIPEPPAALELLVDRHNRRSKRAFDRRQRRSTSSPYTDHQNRDLIQSARGTGDQKLSASDLCGAGAPRAKPVISCSGSDQDQVARRAPGIPGLDPRVKMIYPSAPSFTAPPAPVVKPSPTIKIPSVQPWRRGTTPPPPPTPSDAPRRQFPPEVEAVIAAQRAEREDRSHVAPEAVLEHWEDDHTQRPSADTQARLGSLSFRYGPALVVEAMKAAYEVTPDQGGYYGIESVASITTQLHSHGWKTAGEFLRFRAARKGTLPHQTGVRERRFEVSYPYMEMSRSDQTAWANEMRARIDAGELVQR